MSYLDQITVGSTTYDIQDSTAGASLAVDGSTLSLKDRNSTTLSSVTLPSGLPSVSSADNGKVLSVASGDWAVAAVEALPTVTSSDNGKVLGVDTGAWTVVTAPKEVYCGTSQPTDPNISVWVNPNSSADFAGIPSGGTAGQFLGKHSATDYDIAWTDVHAFPSGGTTGQILSKASTTDYDVTWADLEALPSGGTTGQMLVKATDSNFDVTWATAAAPATVVSPADSSGGAVGTALTFARTDHSHELNVATSGVPVPNGVAALGSATTYARTDHVHASDINKENKKLVLTNVSVPSSAWASDTTYSNFGYRADIVNNNITASQFAEVIFGPDEATSGKFAPICETHASGIYIYSTQNWSSTITIPTVVILGV